MVSNTQVIERLETIKDVPGIDFQLVLDAVRAHLINGFTENFLTVTTAIKKGEEVDTSYLEYFGSMLQYVHYLKTGNMPEPYPIDPNMNQFEALHEYFTKIQPYTIPPAFTIP